MEQKVSFKQYTQGRASVWALTFDGHVFGDQTGHPTITGAYNEGAKYINGEKGDINIKYKWATDSMTRAIVAMHN